MTPTRKRRLWSVLLILVGVFAAVGLTFSALTSNLNHFYSPAQVVAGEAPLARNFRVGGLVLEGSVVRDDLEVQFVATDCVGEVTVAYVGILPDLFREGQGIVAMGQLGSDGIFRADEVLAKHDENYMPPEVADALKGAETCDVGVEHGGAYDTY